MIGIKYTQYQVINLTSYLEFYLKCKDVSIMYNNNGVTQYWEVELKYIHVLL